MICLSGLASTGPATLHMLFKSGTIDTEFTPNMTLGFYADGQLQHYRSLVKLEGESSVGVPRKIQTVKNDDSTVSGNTVTVHIPTGINAREMYEVSLARFHMDKPQPAEVEVCLSRNLIDSDYTRPDLLPSLARGECLVGCVGACVGVCASLCSARCTCSLMRLSTAKGGCPFDKKAMRFAPEVGPDHPCAKM